MDDALNSPQTLDHAPDERRSFLRRNVRLLVAGVLLAGALFYLANLAFQGATVYYLTVDELVSEGSAAYGVQHRVSGKLAADTFAREPEGTLARFALADEGGVHALTTEYDGIVPDLFFNEHSEIIAEGQYGPDGVFRADQIIVKCPSKYVSEGSETPADYAPPPAAVS